MAGYFRSTDFENLLTMSKGKGFLPSLQILKIFLSLKSHYCGKSAIRKSLSAWLTRTDSNGRVFSYYGL